MHRVRQQLSVQRPKVSREVATNGDRDRAESEGAAGPGHARSLVHVHPRVSQHEFSGRSR